eukprot:GHVU01162618.1.p1 GENE.GHVU01162618.1~~GHVU01162618.1.p1  ORF type:complete len:257 (-),score=23.28 GHVU01162618.1:39-809(-)
MCVCLCGSVDGCAYIYMCPYPYVYAPSITVSIGCLWLTSFPPLLLLLLLSSSSDLVGVYHQLWLANGRMHVRVRVWLRTPCLLRVYVCMTVWTRYAYIQALGGEAGENSPHVELPCYFDETHSTAPFQEALETMDNTKIDFQYNSISSACQYMTAAALPATGDDQHPAALDSEVSRIEVPLRVQTLHSFFLLLGETPAGGGGFVGVLHGQEDMRLRNGSLGEVIAVEVDERFRTNDKEEVRRLDDEWADYQTVRGV